MGKESRVCCVLPTGNLKTKPRTNNHKKRSVSEAQEVVQRLARPSTRSRLAESTTPSASYPLARAHRRAPAPAH
jgi:hypothetical protein